MPITSFQSMILPQQNNKHKLIGYFQILEFHKLLPLLMRHHIATTMEFFLSIACSR